MLRQLLATCIFLLFTSPCLAQIEKVSFPSEVRQETTITVADKDIQGKQWNRWTSGRFVVCSLNDAQAKFLHDNLDKIKEWELTRWGLADVPMSAECRLICVDDKQLYKKLFNIDQTKVEVRRDGNGRINLIVIFFLLDDKPARTVPGPLTEAVLAEYEQAQGAKFGWWAHRGMALLNGQISDIREHLADLHQYTSNDQKMYFGRGLLTMTEDQYNKETAENRRLFDNCAMTLCLLLRKEFGQDKLLQFLVAKDPEAALRRIYGFESVDQFDASFKHYMIDLTSDVVGAHKDRPVTPDSYLQIRPKK